jgi:dTDP-glucose 4,6-dehydratase
VRVLVTGGAGFLGAHLVRALLQRGDSVVALDNFSTSDGSGLAGLDNDGRFELVEGDVCDLPDLPEPLDAVAHLACPASPQDYFRLPLETLNIGGRGTSKVLALAQRHQCRVLLASTSEVYGDPHTSPQPESYWGNVNPIGPRSVYDESKRFAEATFMAYRRTLGTNTGIVRIFNTYGPGLRPRDGRVISNFIAQALRGEPLTVYGTGSQTRSFCYVDDLVRGLIAMLDGAEPGPINLGNPTEITVRQLASTVLQLTGSPSAIEHLPPLEDDPTRRRPDISRAAEALGWRPSIPLEEGLRRTIAWQETLLSPPSTTTGTNKEQVHVP